MRAQVDTASAGGPRSEGRSATRVNALRAHRGAPSDVFVLLLLTTLLSSGCATTIRVPSYHSVPPPGGGRFLAGAGKQDITPPPGFPMGGYSIAGRFSRGHWMRLYARAFYFQGASGESVTLVSCDLFAVPRGLHARVAHALSAEGVTPDGLILAATHTHQGPGNYMSSALYNGFASPSSGFSEELFEFLVQRVAEAVRLAIANARESAGPVSLVVKSGRIEHLVRNRAFEAFQRNPDGAAVIGAAASVAPAGCSVNCDRYRAVDPTVIVLEVWRGEAQDAKLVAALVFFAVHPTSMSNHFGLYTPDLVGYAMRRLEREYSATKLVAGFFNGAEGDVSPDWEKRDVVEVRALGRAFANGIQTMLAEPGGTPDSRPIVQARLKAVPRSEFCHGVEPLFGVASFGGAADGYTALHGLGWRRGPNSVREKNGIPGQGQKQPALDTKWLPRFGATRMVGSPESYPREVPVSVARLGPLWIAGVPVEMTTTAGRRLRQRLQADTGAGTVALIGLANEYLSYAATAEEYELQDYEGASTIFGPAQAECLSDLLAAAVEDLERPARRDVESSEFSAGPKGDFGPAFWKEQPLWWTDELEKLVARSSTIPPREWPRFEWTSQRGDPGETVRQQILVYERHAGGWRVLETEDDSNLLVLLVEAGPPRRWSVTWMPPDGVDPGGTFVFQMRRTDGPVQCSMPFSIRLPRERSRSLPLPPGDCSLLKEP
jgi:neutral ceramidase